MRRTAEGFDRVRSSDEWGTGNTTITIPSYSGIVERLEREQEIERAVERE